MKFSVVIPAHDVHLQCFAEVADSVACALQDLGHEAGVERVAQPDTRPIFFGLPLGALPQDAIIYNGEQVSGQSIWAARRLDLTYRNRTIWDYSAVNAERYAEYGLPRPTVVRPGYSEPHSRGFEPAEKTHDVVFFGSSNPRRESVLRQLEEQGLRLLRVPFGIYGAKRDAFVARAHLCINIHFYESAVFEAVRCSYLLQNDVLVLSETSAGSEERLYGAFPARYDALVDRAKWLACETEEFREAERWRQREKVSQVSIKDEVGAALEALDHAPVTYVEQPAEPTGDEGALLSYLQGEQPELTLCMIVKDEAPVIERCLNSVKAHVKRWCIVDTGSTDGTQEIIRRVMADLPGTLHESAWKGFDGSRTEAVDRARQECQGQGWFLLIDADEIFQLDGELVLPEQGYDCFDGWITRCIGCAPWGRSTFLRARKPWFYEMPRHEGLYCREDAPSAPSPIPNVLILSTYEGHRAQSGGHERFAEDARVLEDWLLQHPGHTRCQYYIAQSYRTAANVTPVDRPAMQKAVVHYMKRAAMVGGWEQETHSALYWAADCMDRLGYPREQMHQKLLDAYNQRPSRAEALYSIGRYYREQERWALAELFLRQAVRIPPTSDITPEVDLAIYEWKAKEELAVAISWLAAKSGNLAQWAEARDLNREVLRAPSLPPDDRKRIAVNLEECLKSAPD